MKIKVVSFSEKRKHVDLIVMGFFAKSKISAELKKAEPEYYKAANQAVTKGRFKGAEGSAFPIYGNYRAASEIALLGLGEKKNYQPANLRGAVGRVAQLAKSANAKTVCVCLNSFTAGKIDLRGAAAIFAEISALSSYDFDRHKSSAKKAKETTLELVVEKASQAKSLQKVIMNHQAIAEGVMLARDLINEPGNIMHPQKLAAEARQMAKRKKLSCQILGSAEIKKLKMGGILAVNQGSKTPPAVIILEHGKNYKRKGTVCLIGKGVTFDTGGISIKPSKDMEKMKYDMSGAAAVIGAMSAIADLRLPLHVVAITPAVENMVAADPQRPGDIIRMFNGKTVEVLNTDAEGRLILADALSYAEKYKPKAIVDLATLTGMVVYTFGDKCCGILGNDERLLSKIQKAGEEVGERCWPLPLWKEYEPQIKGHHSDLYNIGGPYGGTITAAKFLEEFVPAKTPWVHMDIAGTAWCNVPRFDCVRGGTGFGVKLLTQFLSQMK